MLAPTPASAASRPAGIDVSDWQAAVDWTHRRGTGVTFAYVKATEGHTYRNRLFAGGDGDVRP